jgi:putative flippase GtrA
MVKISKKSFLQFLKYNLGGLLYFWSAWSIITFLTDDFGLFWTNLVGNGVGIVLNYLVQRYWTFSNGPTLLTSGWKFVVLTVVNLGISYLILNGLVELGITLGVAQFISAGFFTGWNWLWYKYWVFRKVQHGR